MGNLRGKIALNVLPGVNVIEQNSAVFAARG